uniref:Uncharacterized protein n=1 Tax=Tetraselmis sp. GSL018 TaxID=582737 RepID=A0A061QZ60_9CHLO|eukprot:CAMPEP_0177613534 /NCGR_PEP_ID=MMETSP0419_2-20121207/22050_1 /TAXON_ID=582737 /ORGANISM="Tetraselmis sp., Strain GSL018" /LENGTH=176 /DNA_ID=CAMNT_0019110285 /DNA_START=23 /DNA_END=553 /DNA_ORIENTATION=+
MSSTLKVMASGRSGHQLPVSPRGTRRATARVSSRILERRSVLVSPALLSFPVLMPKDSNAAGIEASNLPNIPTRSSAELAGIQDAQKKAIENAESTFQNSELLSNLKARSEANKERYAKELSSKYCQRQAELGVGDCGGLRFIPGATKNGKQKTPKWLQKVLGVDLGDQPDVEVSY